MDTMKEIIQKMKRENGNSNYSQKDLLWYVVHKIDKIDTKFDEKITQMLTATTERVTSCHRTFATRKLVYWVVTIFVMLLGVIATVFANISFK